MLCTLAELLLARNPEVLVRTAHMEIAAPTIAEALADLVENGVKEVVVYPHFLAPGRHSQIDIPALIREAAKPYPELRLHLAEPLGAHPGLVELMLDRIANATPLADRGRS